MSEAKCAKCESHDEAQLVRRCPVCFTHFCEEHAYVMSGRAFCSKGCAQHFFFGDPDD